MLTPPVLAFSPSGWLDTWLGNLASLAAQGSFFNYRQNLYALIALLLVGLICGAVGSLVVGGRMAFFSDAMAHCSFAGVSVGIIAFNLALIYFQVELVFWDWATPIMVGFGLLFGLGIAAVRQRTGLASDTVIGVFFAAAIGLAAALRKLYPDRKLFTLEDFLFGNLAAVGPQDLLVLAGLLVFTGVVLSWLYNPLLLAGFNSSLALSRRISGRAMQLAFVLLLAVIVPLCLRCVGALLINAILIVPAATAMNLSGNLRQLFWRTMAICLGACLGGPLLAWEVEVRVGVPLGTSGTIVLISVILFAVSTLLRSRRAPTVQTA